MSSLAALARIPSTVINSIASMVAAVLEQEQCIREMFYKLIEGNALSFLGTKKLVKRMSPPVHNIAPRVRLPSAVRYMSESRKSALRASYARDVCMFRPGSSQLPRSQRFLSSPITLSGNDAAVNVALRPVVSHISLVQEHRPTLPPCPTPVRSLYMNPRADVMSTLRGATRVLDALVRGAVSEEWLDETRIEQKPFEAPRMTRSYAQRGRMMEAPKMARSYVRAGMVRATASSSSSSLVSTPEGSVSLADTLGKDD